MGNLTPEQAQHMFDSINVFLVFFAVFVMIVKIAFVVLLFILLIKAIKYFHNKTKYDCATCIYKQQYNQQEISKAMKSTLFKDG